MRLLKLNLKNPRTKVNFIFHTFYCNTVLYKLYMLIINQISPVNLWFNLKQIATQTASTVSSTEKYALQHTKSPKESLVGKV